MATKQQFRERFSNIKVYVESQSKSKSIQEQLFKADFEWGEIGKEVSYLALPFIYTDDRYIHCTCDMEIFEQGEKTEVKAADILNVEIIEDKKPKCDFKPYDKVLVRNYKTDKWKASFFSHIEYEGDYADKPLFVCVGEEWWQCIPYEGNEHLLGTTNEPKED